MIEFIHRLTPADAQVDFEVVSLCEHSDDQQVVKVDAFDQQPVAVSHYAVLHHDNCDATANRCLQHSSTLCVTTDKT